MADSSGNRSKPQPLRVAVIDSKEAAANGRDLWLETGDIGRNMPGSFLHAGFTPVVAVRDFGDIWLGMDPGEDPRQAHPSRVVVVESKTWDDLVASMRDSGAGRADSRIRHQLAGLLNLRKEGYTPVVLTIGTVTLPGGKGGKNRGVIVEINGRRRTKSYTYYEIENALAAIQRLGVMVYRAPSTFQTPEAMKHLVNVITRPEHFLDPGLPQVATLGPRMTHLATVLTGTPGVGREMAQRIAHRYGSFHRFYEDADVKDLQQVEGVGKVMAQRIYAAWHGLLTPEEAEELVNPLKAPTFTAETVMARFDDPPEDDPWSPKL